jgi:hypothetical protein
MSVESINNPNNEININENPPKNISKDEESEVTKFINTNRGPLWDAMFLLSTALNTNDETYLQIKPQVIDILKQILNQPRIDVLRQSLEMGNVNALQNYLQSVALDYYIAKDKGNLSLELFSETFISLTVLNSWQRDIIQSYFKYIPFLNRNLESNNILIILCYEVTVKIIENLKQISTINNVLIQRGMINSIVYIITELVTLEKSEKKIIEAYGISLLYKIHQNLLNVLNGSSSLDVESLNNFLKEIKNQYQIIIMLNKSKISLHVVENNIHQQQKLFNFLLDKLVSFSDENESDSNNDEHDYLSSYSIYFTIHSSKYTLKSNFILKDLTSYVVDILNTLQTFKDQPKEEQIKLILELDVFVVLGIIKPEVYSFLTLEEWKSLPIITYCRQKTKERILFMILDALRSIKEDKTLTVGKILKIVQKFTLLLSGYLNVYPDEKLRSILQSLSENSTNIAEMNLQNYITNNLEPDVTVFLVNDLLSNDNLKIISNYLFDYGHINSSKKSLINIIEKDKIVKIPNIFINGIYYQNQRFNLQNKMSELRWLGNELGLENKYFSKRDLLENIILKIQSVNNNTSLPVNNTFLAATLESPKRNRNYTLSELLSKNKQQLNDLLHNYLPGRTLMEDTEGLIGIILYIQSYINVNLPLVQQAETTITNYSRVNIAYLPTRIMDQLITYINKNMSPSPKRTKNYFESNIVPRKLLKTDYIMKYRPPIPINYWLPPIIDQESRYLMIGSLLYWNTTLGILSSKISNNVYDIEKFFNPSWNESYFITPELINLSITIQNIYSQIDNIINTEVSFEEILKQYISVLQKYTNYDLIRIFNSRHYHEIFDKLSRPNLYLQVSNNFYTKMGEVKNIVNIIQPEGVTVVDLQEILRILEETDNSKETLLKYQLTIPDIYNPNTSPEEKKSSFSFNAESLELLRNQLMNNKIRKDLSDKLQYYSYNSFLREYITYYMLHRSIFEKLKLRQLFEGLYKFGELLNKPQLFTSSSSNEEEKQLFLRLQKYYNDLLPLIKTKSLNLEQKFQDLRLFEIINKNLEIQASQFSFSEFFNLPANYFDFDQKYRNILSRYLISTSVMWLHLLGYSLVGFSWNDYLASINEELLVVPYLPETTIKKNNDVRDLSNIIIDNSIFSPSPIPDLLSPPGING